MALQLRRGLAVEVATIVPAEGEPIYEIDTKKLRIGDGQTLAGTLISANLQNLDISVLTEGTKNVTVLQDNLTGKIRLANQVNTNAVTVSDTGTHVTGEFFVNTATITRLVFADGSVQTTADTANPDQALNTTSNVKFNSVDVKTNVLFGANTLSVSSTGTLLVNGSPIVGGNTFDQSLNTTNTATFAGVKTNLITTATGSPLLIDGGNSGGADIVIRAEMVDFLDSSGNLVFRTQAGQVLSNVTFRTSDIEGNTGLRVSAYDDSGNSGNITFITDYVGSPAGLEFNITSADTQVFPIAVLTATLSTLHTPVKILQTATLDQDLKLTSSGIVYFGTNTVTVSTTGTFLVNGSAIAGNPFNQSLNTSDNVNFNQINGVTLKNNELDFGSLVRHFSTATTLSSTNSTEILRYPKAKDASKVSIKARQGNNIHLTELSIITDGSDIWLTEYGTIFNSSSLGTFTAAIDSNDLVVKITPASASTMTVKVSSIQFSN